MNKERILELADLIEMQPHTPHDADFGFNMHRFSRPSGSPACIGGWAAWIALGKIDMNEYIGSLAQVACDWLELPEDIGDIGGSLFCPDIDFDGITPSMASEVLRNLVRTGEVKWKI